MCSHKCGLISHGLMKQTVSAAPHRTATNIYCTHAQRLGDKDLKIRPHPMCFRTQSGRDKSITDVDAN